MPLPVLVQRRRGLEASDPVDAGEDPVHDGVFAIVDQVVVGQLTLDIIDNNSDNSIDNINILGWCENTHPQIFPVF